MVATQELLLSIPRSKASFGSVDIVARILAAYAGRRRYAYEREHVWYIGIGSQATLTISPDGASAICETASRQSSTPLRGDAQDVIKEFTSHFIRPGQKAFGQAGFNYSAYSHGLPFIVGSWPLLTIVVPSLVISVFNDHISVQHGTLEEIAVIEQALQIPYQSSNRPFAPDELKDGHTYQALVRESLKEIHDGKYEKIIASRPLELPGRVDMIDTLLVGRSANTPRRSFLFDHLDFSATGFCPELVMSVVDDNKVITEPLAGTRACPSNIIERARLKRDLLNDPKEVMEHIISVQEAMRELERLCAAETIGVSDLMAVKERGKVQHLASTVQGSLREGTDAWDAFHVLFPAITASGIPKLSAIEAIHRLEKQPRELYSGAVLFFEGQATMEAALVLRSVFQDAQRSWVQAGAGIIALSTPERELTETCEKLRSIAPFVMAQAMDETAAGAQKL